MQEKKVIEFLIRNNGRIQIVMLCVLLGDCETFSVN